MRQSKSFVEQRRASIAQILSEEGRASVADLAKRLDVSPLTIRRDLDDLEGRGAVHRRYGEAVRAERGSGRDVGTTDGTRLERTKEAIARAAAGLVQSGSSVFVNTSSTALLAIEYITSHNVTVITNSSRAGSLTASPNITVLVTGGEIRMPRGVLSGEFALANIRSVTAKLCYVGCAGVSASAGVTSTTLQEATVNSLMVERSDFCALLADSSKLDGEAGFRYAGVDDIDLLVTDVNAPTSSLDRLRDAGVGRIVLVDPDDPATWKVTPDE